jgi:hypothetical protein
MYESPFIYLAHRHSSGNAITSDAIVGFSPTKSKRSLGILAY